MDRYDAPPTSGDLAFSLLTLGGLRLAVPQADIDTLEPAADIDPASPPPHGIGWIRLGRQRWPVFCLNGELRPRSERPADHGTCAVLNAGGHAIALLCTDVSLLHLPAAGLAPLPPAMALPGRPIRGLAQMDGAVLCLSSARDLAEYVKTMIYETH